MKYMLIIYGNDEIWGSYSEEEFAAIVREVDAANTALFASGELVGAYGVGGPDLVKQVHVADGVPAVTDGPYIETKEHIGSFSILDVADEARALEVAAEHPFARVGQVELRPLLHEAADEM